MAITSTDNQTAAAHTDEVDLVASKDASTDETTEPAPDETSKLVSRQPQRPRRTVPALEPRAPRRLRTTPQPACILNQSCSVQCAPPAPTPSRHL
eukprot:scaffold103185_cov63-Phaeocystis_antarctica.AAC.6